MTQLHIPHHVPCIIQGQATQGLADSFAVLNPATERIIALCSSPSAEQIEYTISTAQHALSTWQHSDEATRKAVLMRIALGIEQHADELAQLIVQEQGKPLSLAHTEVAAAIAWTRYQASLDLSPEVLQDDAEKRIELHHRPMGIVVSITPWNWPLMIAIWHIMPALRAGNVVINKPSEYTPLATAKLVQIMQRELPAGVVSILTGDAETGAQLSQHPLVNKIVFTGSIQTGLKIKQHTAASFKYLTLELGGNDAGIVLPDSDLDKIAARIFNAAFINMGQTCAALKRVYVHESQYAALSQRLANLAETQILGDGLAPETTFGPVQNAKHYQKVKQLITEACTEGAQVLTTAQPLPAQGYFIAPTILIHVNAKSRVVQEEQFGPVLPILSYQNVEQVLTELQHSDYALGASIWSSDIDKAQRYIQHLNCGTVWLNTHAEVLPHVPFGGWKHSGLGVQFGQQGLLENTLSQVIHIHKG